jgi:hypothetical protein
MPGFFRLAHGDGPAFYEAWVLREAGGSLVLDLKHFAPDMTGWEAQDETVRFPLLRLEPDTAYFDRLTYHRAHADTLHVWVALRGEEGYAEERFVLTRSPIGR